MSIYRKAERRKAKLRLAITGPSGSGKTYSALLVAFGIGGKIALLDTENGSGDLYSSLGDYDVCQISAPFTVQKYIDAIKDAENSGYDVLILDSISAEWAGSGGLLNLHTQLTSNNRNNSFSAWLRSITLSLTRLSLQNFTSSALSAQKPSMPRYRTTKARLRLRKSDLGLFRERALIMSSQRFLTLIRITLFLYPKTGHRFLTVRCL